jgi:hypothetical protein
LVITLENMIQVVHPGSGPVFYPYLIPDPGIKMPPDPGSRSATLLLREAQILKRTTEQRHFLGGPRGAIGSNTTRTRTRTRTRSRALDGR